MSDEPKKPLNYWQADPDEEPVQHAPEAERDAPVATPVQDEALTEDDPISWEAAEYIHLHKGAGWYILFFIVVLAFIAVDVFILKSITFSVLVVVMAVAVIIYSRRAPKGLHYTLSQKHGLYIGERLYSYDEFKAFGVIKDGEHHSIMLIPVKRFAPGVSVYFPEEIGEQIVDILGSRLPMEDLKLDAVDILVRKLRL